MPNPNIKGKEGAILLNPGGVGSVTYFALTVQHPPPVGGTDFTMAGPSGTWTVVELSRWPHPPASPNRSILILKATQATSAKKSVAPGDTDDITVTVTNSTTTTLTDSASMDGVFGP